MDTLPQDFSAQINFSEEKVDDEVKKEDQEEEEENDDDHGHEQEEDDEETDADDDFSFVFDGVDTTAGEETRLVFPLFNTDLLVNERLPVRPPVKHVYAEHPVASSSSSGDDVIAGPCCEWSKDKAAAVGAGGRDGCCKKSNSTGFSKLWRFRDFVHRSNSDGRDAFVFLHHPSTEKPKKNMAEKKIAGAVKVNGKVGGENNVTAQQKKKKNATALAHERYMKSKAKDEDRRRSYLPYRPELVGIFTNVNSGLTRNIHPY